MEENKNEFEDMMNELDMEEPDLTSITTEDAEEDIKKQTSTNDQIDISKEQPNTDLDDEEVPIDNYIGEEYVNTPEVGKSIEFTVKTIKNIKNKAKHTAKNRITGEEFVVGVKKKDGETIRIDVVTDEDKHFVLNSWSMFNLFQRRDSVFAQEVKKRGTYAGIKVKITRHYDGSVASKKAADVMKLYDLKDLAEAEEYKKTVAKAMDDNMLASLEIIN